MKAEVVLCGDVWVVLVDGEVVDTFSNDGEATEEEESCEFYEDLA